MYQKYAILATFKITVGGIRSRKYTFNPLSYLVSQKDCSPRDTIQKPSQDDRKHITI